MAQLLQLTTALILQKIKEDKMVGEIWTAWITVKNFLLFVYFLLLVKALHKKQIIKPF